MQMCNFGADCIDMPYLVGDRAAELAAGAILRPRFHQHSPTPASILVSGLGFIVVPH